MLKLRRWTREEEQKLLEALQSYRGNQRPVRGQMEFVWQTVASEINRTPAACRIREMEIRKGFRKPLQ